MQDRCQARTTFNDDNARFEIYTYRGTCKKRGHVLQQVRIEKIKTDNAGVTHPDIQLLASRIHAALPQTQCTRCGYPDCAAYADAIAQRSAPINQCPPGGAEGVARLAAITGQPAVPLNPANGLEAPRAVAVIDEAWCIGCTLCLPVCPTDAILGSNKMMHTVIDAHCTGCELCIAVCPVDCIGLENVTGEQTGWHAWRQEDAEKALKRYEFHISLYLNDVGEGTKTALKPIGEVQLVQSKQSVIEGAVAKARAARQAASAQAAEPCPDRPAIKTG